MALSDRTIRQYIEEGKIKIYPCDLDKQLGCVGVDLRLGNAFREFKVSHKPFIDLTKGSTDADTELVVVQEGEKFIIHPGEFVLGATVETVELPNTIVGRLDGRSSLGRIGIIVHSTAGRVDPGWKGKLTLEISNIGKLPIALIPGMKFCCLMFEETSTPVDRDYNYDKRYSEQELPVTSRISDEFGEKK